MEINEELIQKFGEWLKLGGKSPDTITSYCSTISTYCRGDPLSKINRREFFGELREVLEGRGRSLGTVSRHTYAVKAFLKFVNDAYAVPIVNILQIKCRRPPRKNPKYLERDEIERIRKLETTTVCEIRDRALFEFLLHTGCRISEAVNLNWNEVDLEKRETTVIGKGLKRRVVFFGEAAGWIACYLEKRNCLDLPLFLNQYHTWRLNRQDGRLAIQHIGEKAGLTKRIYPHILRATFATYMIRAGTDPKTLQEMLGHDDVETTLRYYVGVSYERMREVHERFEKVLR